MSLRLAAGFFGIALCWGEEARFEVKLARRAEVLAHVELCSPGADWAQAGREAALADVWVDGTIQQQIMVFAGAEPYTYPVFLGELAAGRHSIRITRNAGYSAPGAGLEVRSMKFTPVEPGQPLYAVLANAPVLFAREDTVGRFSDVPLLVYCERLRDSGGNYLQYTVIFSNEDGGTSTRALMARWGRTTDIEYVYRRRLDPNGERGRATIQTKDHKEVAFDGQYWGRHPLLTPVTVNNMVAGNHPTQVRYQIAPVEVRLEGHPRERVMDLYPVTWKVMRKELEREGKLRPYGSSDGEKVSDPRNYLYLDANLRLEAGAAEFLVRLRGENGWRSSSLGRSDYAIARDGWVRTTIELPPGARLADIVEFGFACHPIAASRGRPPVASQCRVDPFGEAFLLDEQGIPGPRLELRRSLAAAGGTMERAPLQ